MKMTLIPTRLLPRVPHSTQHSQMNQPTSQSTTTAPTTVWRPPPLCLQKILLPIQPPCRLPPVIPMPRSCTIRPRALPPTSLQTLLFLPPVAPSVTPHDLWPHSYNMVPTHTPTATPRYNYIEPDDDRHDCPTTRSSTPPQQSIHLINTCLPGNIAIQAIHHTMTLEVFKVATQLQWTRPIIDFDEH
jgi:hypothetical protein